MRRNLRAGVFLSGVGLVAAAVLVACSVPNPFDKPHGAAADPVTQALREKVKTIVVIYAENRAFDSLYGNFPGANGLSGVVDAAGRPLAAYLPQLDRDGTPLSKLPQTWGGVTAPGYKPVVTQAQSAGLPNAPFSIETAFTAQSKATLSVSTVTRDLCPPLLRESDADRRRPQRSVCGLVRCRRSHHGSLRLQPIRALRLGAPIRAGGPVFPGRVRRLVSQSSIFDLRLRAGVSRPRTRPRRSPRSRSSRAAPTDSRCRGSSSPRIRRPRRWRDRPAS